VCGAARSAAKQDHISTLELLGALGPRARGCVLGSSECLTSRSRRRQVKRSAMDSEHIGLRLGTPRPLGAQAPTPSSGWPSHNGTVSGHRIRRRGLLLGDRGRSLRRCCRLGQDCSIFVNPGVSWKAAGLSPVHPQIAASAFDAGGLKRKSTSAAGPPWLRIDARRAPTGVQDGVAGLRSG
jgi:hypothetical protein